MGLKAGDMVRVIGGVTGDQLSIPAGTEAAVCCVWEGEEYPVELVGFYECLRADEVEVL